MKIRLWLGRNRTAAVLGGLLFASVALNVVLLASTALNTQFDPCGWKASSPDSFQRECEAVRSGEELVLVLERLGPPSSTQCTEGECRTQIFGGGKAMFCDSCVVEFFRQTQKVTRARWLFGDS